MPTDYRDRRSAPPARQTETYRFDDLRVAQQPAAASRPMSGLPARRWPSRGRTNGGVSWTELFTRAPFEGNNLIHATGAISTGASIQRQYHGDLIGTTEGLSDGTQNIVDSYDTSAAGYSGRLPSAASSSGQKFT